MLNRTEALGTLAALLLGVASFGTAAAQGTATPALTAADQPLGSANTVVVASVTAAQDGWVVIHESNPDGTIMLPGIIGKTAVKAGDTKNVSITLDKQISTPAKLWPMLHIDAGTTGTYEFPGADTPVTVNGNIVMQAINVSAAAAQATPALVAKDQTLENNNTVVVESVTAAQDGWVVIHESNPDGTILLPGIIGKAAVKAGTTTNVKIVLEKSVAAADGAKLWPMLHIDAGTIGTYEFPGADTPVTVNGNIVMLPIMVMVQQMAPEPAPANPAPAPAIEATLTAGDQTISNNTVIVGMVTAAQDGWVVIHESNADGTIMLPGIIGKTAVKAGMSHNVAIVLDKQVADGAKLWPMLHIDAGTIGTYEFPGADTPVTVNGQIVMQSIVVNNASGMQAPGMPRTGSSDLLLVALFGAASVAALAGGTVTRRLAAKRK